MQKCMQSLARQKKNSAHIGFPSPSNKRVFSPFSAPNFASRLLLSDLRRSLRRALYRHLECSKWQHAPSQSIHITPRGLPAPKRARILRYLLLGWRPHAIAEECNVGERTVYNIEENLFRYGSIVKPRYRMLGRPSKCIEAGKNALLEWLLRKGWRHQDEMVYWLWHERGVYVSQSTISRLLKKTSGREKSYDAFRWGEAKN